MERRKERKGGKKIHRTNPVSQLPSLQHTSGNNHAKQLEKRKKKKNWNPDKGSGCIGECYELKAKGRFGKGEIEEIEET